MALDVHLATKSNDAATTRPVFQWEEPEHSAVFCDKRLDWKQFPMLRRMVDYYSDARFAGDEILRLIDELTVVTAMHRPRSSPYAALVGFRMACEQAVAENKIVICFCD
jgi:hypothetical protein